MDLGPNSELAFMLWFMFVLLKLGLAQRVCVTGRHDVPRGARACAIGAAAALGLAGVLGAYSNWLFVEPNTIFVQVDWTLGAARIGLLGYGVAELGDVLLMCGLVLILMRREGKDVAS